MRKKQTSLESFFEEKERPNDERAEEAEDCKAANKMKVGFKRKYQKSYVNYWFIAIGDSHFPSLLCIIYGNALSKEAMKLLKLPCHMESKHPALKQTFGVFQKKNSEHKEQKQLLKATTSSKCVCTESIFLSVNHIAEAKKPLLKS